MTSTLYDKLSERTKRIGKLVANSMPHLPFALWDLAEFMHTFHNVRRNIVFIECEKIAHEEVKRLLASDEEFRDCIVYSGERKPKTVNEEWASAKSAEIRDIIVIISRSDFMETNTVAESNLRVPGIERRLVDLMAYAMRGYLPLTVEEALAAWTWFIKEGELRISFLQRYATRRYLGWFLSVFLFKLNKNGDLASVDPRYIENGSKYYEALKRVEEI
ncbi:MAG: DUF6577 family protein [Candidatus Micrarchaeota archaeon]